MLQGRMDEKDRRRAREIGERIKRRRQELRLLQEALAEQGRVSKSFMSELEAGESIANGLTYVRLANALRVSVDWLLEGKVEAAAVAASRVDPLSKFPMVSYLAEEQGWSHRRALEVAAALAAIEARRTAGNRHWEPTREEILRLVKGWPEDA